MCRMCDWLGEGEIWYKNPKNYANRLYKLREPGKKPQSAMLSEGGGGRLQEAIEAKADGDEETFNRIIAEMNKRDAKRPGGHTLPLPDAVEVVSLMGTPVGAMMCICRKNVRGEEERNINEYSCSGLGTGMFKWERWPERYRGGVEFLSPKEAADWLEYWDKRGMMHLIMQEGGDFLGGICNCDYPDCGAIRNRMDYGLKYGLSKAEYICAVDYEKCTGCGECLGRCHFNSLKYEATIDKPNIDHFSCFGCGLCMTACSRNAINLVQRKTLPALVNVW